MGNDSLWISHLPKSTHIDPTQIEGNVSLEQKQAQANIFSFFIDGAGSSPSGYGVTLGKRVKYVSMNINEVDGRGLQAEGICEVAVTKDMVNVFNVLHGACAAYLIDLCSSAPLVSLGIYQGNDTSGVSQSMNIIYHSSPKLGAELRIISNSISNQGKIRAARCEIRDKKTDALLVSAVHTKVGGGEKAAKLPVAKL
ncbi:hypothetical protein EW146_g9163 [Bondarzewia mesenterica]|uniref:Thioesterase domain-containing protein n=1 Tax=Bondarzewia mesenterica TaxID=1095465 RepID=A0A4S4L8Z0_9AGAM|nr:hypothetical protein EW146_g9163 [Bondarzewia mesenterica]